MHFLPTITNSNCVSHNLISIVIPTYNSELFIKNSLASVIEQSINLNLNFEIILVDDFSTDRTVSIVKENFASVKLVRHSLNTGQIFATITGINASSGSVIITLDDDEQYSLSKLPEVIAYMRKEKLLLVYCYGNTAINKLGNKQKIGELYKKVVALLLFNTNLNYPISSFRVIDRALTKLYETKVIIGNFWSVERHLIGSFAVARNYIDKNRFSLIGLYKHQLFLIQALLLRCLLCSVLLIPFFPFFFIGLGGGIGLVLFILFTIDINRKMNVVNSAIILK